MVIKNLYLDSILKDSSSFLTVLKYAKELNITTIAGNEEFTVFSFNNNFYNCYSLYYRPNTYSEIDTDCKV